MTPTCKWPIASALETSFKGGLIYANEWPFCQQGQEALGLNDQNPTVPSRLI